MNKFFLFALLCATICLAGTLEYYSGDDFAILKPIIADSLDATGNLGDGFAVILDRPTLIFDPVQNSFEQRIIMRFNVPDYKQEMESRLFNKAFLNLSYTGKTPVVLPEMAVYSQAGTAAPQFTSQDFAPNTKILTLPSGTEEIQPGSIICLDVTKAFQKAKPGTTVTLSVAIASAPKRMELSFDKNAFIEIKLAQQVHSMRGGIPRERMVARLDDAADWQVELNAAPEDAKVEIETTKDYTFYGWPAIRVNCENLTTDSEIILTPKTPLSIGSNFEMLELWSWGELFSYEVTRKFNVTIADEDGNEYSRDLSMQFGTRGPCAHLCDYRDLWTKFDTSKEYTLARISIKAFNPSAKRESFGLGPVSVYPNTKPKIEPIELTVKIPANEEGMVPPVKADSISVTQDGSKYVFSVESISGNVVYTYEPKTGTFSDFTITCEGETFQPMIDGGILHHPNGQREQLVKGTLIGEEFDQSQGILKVTWSDNLESEATSTWIIKLVNRSLVIDCTSTKKQNGGLSLGYAQGFRNPEIIEVPYFCFNGRKTGRLGPGIVHSNGVFFFGGVDFYISNATDFFTDARIVDGKIQYNGGSEYCIISDFTRLPLKDRVYLTASTRMEDVFPQVPTPDLIDRYKPKHTFFIGQNWANIDLYRHFTDMGMKDLFVWMYYTDSPSDNPPDRLSRAAHGDNNHFSYHFGGNEGRPAPELYRNGYTQQQFMEAVRKDGNMVGKYCFYNDINTTNRFFEPMMLTRNIYLQPIMGCLMFVEVKPYLMPAYQKLVADECEKSWGKMDGVYSDVITIRCFWGNTVDCEPGYPLAGKQHIEATAQLCKQELERNGNYVISEGHFQWLYSGLTTGSYGSISTNNPQGPTVAPLLPIFNATRLGPRSILVGMAPAAHFYQNSGENKMNVGEFHSTGVRQYYASLLSLGNAAMATEWDFGYMSMHGVAKMWYLFMPLHPLYLLEEIESLEYFNGTDFEENSKAMGTKSYLEGQIKKTYKNGTVIFVNYNGKKAWTITTPEGSKVTLPPWGFYAVNKEAGILSYAILDENGEPVDCSITNEQLYIDAWDGVKSVGGMTIKGAGAIRRIDDRTLMFFPLGQIPEGTEQPDQGVEEVTIDLTKFTTAIAPYSVKVEGKLADGTWHDFQAELKDTMLSIHPAGNYRQYKITFETGIIKGNDAMTGICINEDSTNFLFSFGKEWMNQDGLEKFARGYAMGQVERVIYNPCAQRSAVSSKVLDPLWTGVDFKEDGSAFLYGKKLTGNDLSAVTNAKLLHDKGLDQYKIWLDTTRKCGRQAWLSVRMNDVHCADYPDSYLHGHLWREHPEYYRAPYDKTSWMGKALDYAYPEVRQNILAVIAELLERYDVDGIELDFTRFFAYFKPGFEILDAHFITEVMRSVRQMTKKADNKIQVGVRIPGHPDHARRLGLDFITWSKESLVDVYVLSNFWPCPDGDMPIELWRQMLGDQVEIDAGLEVMAQAFPGEPKVIMTKEMVAGLAAQYLYRGADKIYFFNLMHGKTGMLDDASFDFVKKNVGSLETVNRLFRRHFFSTNNLEAPGLWAPWPLPCSIPPSAGPWRALRINVGGDTEGKNTSAVFGFADEFNVPMEIRVNTILVTSEPKKVNMPVPPTISCLLEYELPPGAIHDGDNVIQFKRMDNAEDNNKLLWFEFDVK